MTDELNTSPQGGEVATSTETVTNVEQTTQSQGLGNHLMEIMGLQQPEAQPQSTEGQPPETPAEQPPAEPQLNPEFETLKQQNEQLMQQMAFFQNALTYNPQFRDAYQQLQQTVDPSQQQQTQSFEILQPFPEVELPQDFDPLSTDNIDDLTKWADARAVKKFNEGINYFNQEVGPRIQRIEQRSELFDAILQEAQTARQEQYNQQITSTVQNLVYSELPQIKGNQDAMNMIAGTIQFISQSQGMDASNPTHWENATKKAIQMYKQLNPSLVTAGVTQHVTRPAPVTLLPGTAGAQPNRETLGNRISSLMA